jgi:hypothetical protein
VPFIKSATLRTPAPPRYLRSDGAVYNVSNKATDGGGGGGDGWWW